MINYAERELATDRGGREVGRAVSRRCSADTLEYFLVVRRNPRNFKFSPSNFTCLLPMFTGKFRLGIRLRFDSSQGIRW